MTTAPIDTRVIETGAAADTRDWIRNGYTARQLGTKAGKSHLDPIARTQATVNADEHSRSSIRLAFSTKTRRTREVATKSPRSFSSNDTNSFSSM